MFCGRSRDQRCRTLSAIKCPQEEKSHIRVSHQKSAISVGQHSREEFLGKILVGRDPHIYGLMGQIPVVHGESLTEWYGRYVDVSRAVAEGG